MSNHIADRIDCNKQRIVALWEARAAKEIVGAKGIRKLPLSNSLSEFLDELADMLRSKTTTQANHQTALRKETSQEHGKNRAAASGYLIQEVIFEYHILRQVIFEVLEQDEPLSPSERNTIIDAIEKAVNDAASQFSDTLRDIREQFVLMLTHDLRTPLTAAKSASELIMKKPCDHTLCAKASSAIFHAMERLDGMIQNLLNASRVRAGEPLTINPKNINLTSVVHEVIEEYRNSHPQRLRLSGASEEIWRFWCPDGLRRVLENLISNALKYGDANSLVTVTLDPAAEVVKIVVHNEGNPIPLDAQSILFEQFRRTKTAVGQKPGWGLGLLLTKGLVEAHGGTIQVHSSAEHGTDFIVTLPRRATQAKAA